MAVTLTAQALADAIGKPLAVAERLLPVASALVLRFTEAAPDSISDEAVVRTSGWLANQPASACSRDQVALPGGLGQTFNFRPSIGRAAREWGYGPAESLESPPGRAYSWERCGDSRKPRYAGSRRGLHVPFPSGFCWRRGCRRFFG